MASGSPPPQTPKCFFTIGWWRTDLRLNLVMGLIHSYELLHVVKFMSKKMMFVVGKSHFKLTHHARLPSINAIHFWIFLLMSSLFRRKKASIRHINSPSWNNNLIEHRLLIELKQHCQLKPLHRRRILGYFVHWRRLIVSAFSIQCQCHVFGKASSSTVQHRPQGVETSFFFWFCLPCYYHQMLCRGRRFRHKTVMAILSITIQQHKGAGESVHSAQRPQIKGMIDQYPRD